jgi:hypothetical protein
MQLITKLALISPQQTHIVIVPCNLEKVEEASRVSQRFTVILVNPEWIQFRQILRVVFPINFCCLSHA